MSETLRMQRLLERLEQVRKRTGNGTDPQDAENQRNSEAQQGTNRLTSTDISQQDDEARLLKQRAAQLARTCRPLVSAKQDEGTERFLLFSLGQDSYGIPLAHVQCVRANPRVTKLAAAPTELKGITYHRGRILPLLNPAYLLTSELLTAEPSAGSEATRLIVLEQDQIIFGLMVERIDGVVNSKMQHLDDLSLMLPRAVRHLFKGMTRERQIVLDVPRLTDVVRKTFLTEPDPTPDERRDR